MLLNTMMMRNAITFFWLRPIETEYALVHSHSSSNLIAHPQRRLGHLSNKHCIGSNLS